VAEYQDADLLTRWCIVHFVYRRPCRIPGGSEAWSEAQA
jgi:hypothetical protein